MRRSLNGEMNNKWENSGSNRGFFSNNLRISLLGAEASFLPVPSALIMDVDAFEDRQLGFEVKLKELDNADDDYRAADASSTSFKLRLIANSILPFYGQYFSNPQHLFRERVPPFCKR